MAERKGRISAEEYDHAWSNFAEIWPDVDIVDLTADLTATAAELTRSLSLRGYDAVHCASAADLNDPDLVAAAGDTQLLTAWRSLGVVVLDTNLNDSPS